MPKSSFRDPAGFLFEREGVLYRQINPIYKTDYDLFLSSGLYEELVSLGHMVSHQEVAAHSHNNIPAYKIIQPKKLPFISYPYEWSFSQLKDAALLTLLIQKMALSRGMTLKDASAYNVQYYKGKPVFIDTLSFEQYRDGTPWVAFRQFCQHFLAPLSLVALKDYRLFQLQRTYLDGIPLDLASSLLPLASFLNFGLFTNIHLHAKAQAKYSDKPIRSGDVSYISKEGMLAIVRGLEGTISALKYSPRRTQWGEYYRDIHYPAKAFEAKKKIIGQLIDKLSPVSVLDLGANDGFFSRVASAKGIPTISIDSDPVAVENNYLAVKQNQEQTIMPLLVDLTNPSGDIGWANVERKSVVSRCHAELVMALAIQHHLVINNNLPFSYLANFLKSLGRWLIIEYVPKNDPQVKRLLSSRVDIFSNYTPEEFERIFSQFYDIEGRYPLPDSSRVIYLMLNKNHAATTVDTLP